MERDFVEEPRKLRGYVVRATDGPLGVVVDANEYALLVRTRRVTWTRRRRVLVIPARAVDSIDVARRHVLLNRTRRQVAQIPQPNRIAGRAEEGMYYPGSAQLPEPGPWIAAPPGKKEPEESQPT
jgi:hypothetical protein